MTTWGWAILDQVPESITLATLPECDVLNLHCYNHRIGNVASLLPAGGLSARTTNYLRLFLAALAVKRAPQDGRQQDYLKEALRAVDRLEQVTHKSPAPGAGR